MSTEDSPLQKGKGAAFDSSFVANPGTAWHASRKYTKAPSREDHRASFSIYAEGRRWRDFGNSDGGDAVDFVAHAADARQWREPSVNWYWREKGQQSGQGSQS